MEDTARIIALLQREYLFQGLNPEQLANVASKFKSITLEHNTIVFQQGAPPDCFYIIFDGNVRITRRSRGKERLINILGPGDFFGEQALLLNAPRSAAATTIERTVLLRLDPDGFAQLLQEYPKIRPNLAATAESRRLARKQQFNWLGADEVIYFMTRKHDIFLVRALIFPILLALAGIPLLVFAFAMSQNQFINQFTGILGILMPFVGLIWAIWNAIDWGNDYYIVTTQRVVWQEKMVGLYDSRREAPLETVLAVNVTSSQLGQILGYGNVNVRTFTGGILMRNVNNPKQFASFVEGYKARVQYISKELEAKQMEKDLKQALERQRNKIAPFPSGPVYAQAEPPKPKKSPSYRERLDTFFKVRYEQDGTITYRKHWFVLAQKAWIPLFAILILILLMILVIPMTLSASNSYFVYFVIMLGFMVFTGLAMWFGYNLWDWSNDIYRVTPDQILDIERRPLGREEKKTASLESILSIEHTRENVLHILFNFGPVTINIGQTKFIFDDVYNPDQVHQDIADFREALNRRKREAENKRERERMINWLVTFYDQTGKLEEQAIAEAQAELLARQKALEEIQNKPAAEEFWG